MPRFSVKWRDKEQAKKRIKTWEISDVPLKNKTEAKERFLFEIKDRFGLKKKDIEIKSISKKYWK